MISFRKTFWLLVPLLLGVQTGLIYAKETPVKEAVEVISKEPTAEEIAEITPEEEVPKKAAPIKAPTPRILGWKEWVWVVKPDFVLRAKLDTGARTNSIHATNLETLELDGQRWVKFTISDPQDDKGMRLRHKAPITRVALIKNDTGGLDERYVVSLPVHVAGEMVDCEFTLNDRHNMVCGVLIGRNLLQQLGAVDSSRKYLWDQPALPKKVKKAKKGKSSKQ